MARGRREGDLVGPYSPPLHSALARARVAAGFTQVDLAMAAGISERSVRALESVTPRSRRGWFTYNRLIFLLATTTGSRDQVQAAGLARPIKTGSSGSTR